jgi:hypothetical protein
MIITEDRELEADSASMLGVTLLGQLVRHLMEATHVLEFVTGQVDLNLGEATTAINAAVYEANQAFQAASLLTQGAALDARWSDNASRPKAIFARHRAAVAAGAPRVEPTHVPTILHREPSPVSREELPPKPPARIRPLCGKPTKTTGGLCANWVVVLEHGVLAAGCAIHLPTKERPSYERQKAQTDAWMSATTEHQELDNARMMADATALWLRRQARELDLRWDDFCDLVEITGDPITETSQGSSYSQDRQWTACASCDPYFVNMTALASVGMQFLYSWAADQPPPRWADPAWPAGDWLLELPPPSPDDHELDLHMAVTAFAKLGTPTDDTASAVRVREQEIFDVLLGQFTLSKSLRRPSDRPGAPEKPLAAAPTVASPRPGARPVNSKRQNKKRGKK